MRWNRSFLWTIGTPARLETKTIDFRKTVPHQGDNPPLPFSFMNKNVWIKPEDQMYCHLTHTTLELANIVRENTHQNRHVLYGGQGPRYCPSIESKILRFKNQTHPVWLEPGERWNIRRWFPFCGSIF